jgi:hypothetical protein
VGTNAWSMKSLSVGCKYENSSSDFGNGKRGDVPPDFIGSANAGLVLGRPFCLRVMFGYDILFHVSITTRVIWSAYNVYPRVRDTYHVGRLISFVSVIPSPSHVNALIGRYLHVASG